MKFDARFLDELRSRATLSQVVGATVQLRKSGTSLKGLCPFHKEKTPSFNVNDAQGFYHCFGCGVGGDIFDFIINTEGLSFPEAVEKVADDVGVLLPKPDYSSEKKNPDPPQKTYYPLLQEATVWFQSQLEEPLGQQAREYLHKRGISQEFIHKFQLGYAPRGKGLETYLRSKGYCSEDMIKVGLLGRNQERNDLYPYFRDRLIFPIMDRRGRVIAFGGRTLGENQPKYLNSPESPIFNKKQILYAHHWALKAAKEKKDIIVCEGYMDVIALHMAGFTGAVAPLGTAMGEEQLESLWKISDEPTLCFDGDLAGKKAMVRVAQRALPILRPGKSVRFSILPDKEDPDTLIRSGRVSLLKEILTRAQSLSDIIWQSLVEEANPFTPERQAFLYRAIGKLTESIKDSAVRISYQKNLRDRFYKTFSGRKNKSQSPTFSVAQNTVFDPHTLQGRLLLVTILNHPSIVPQIMEELLAIEFPIPEWTKLSHDIIHWVENNKELDRNRLRSHLYALGYQEFIEKFLGDSLYIHGRFAHPHAEERKALEGWRQIYQTMIYDRQSMNDLSLAQEELSQEMSLDNWHRIKELKLNEIAHKENKLIKDT